MELLARMEVWQWLIPALCDLVALCAAAAVAIVWRKGPARLAEVRPVAMPSIAVPRMEQIPPAEASPRRTPVREEKPARADVSRALAAIGRWENHYGSARGITELARWVDGQKPARERASV